MEVFLESSEVLSSDELAKHSKAGKLPTFKIREKKCFPYDPAEEKALLETYYSTHEQVLSRKKVSRIKDLMHADWDNDLKRAVTNQIKGKITQHMGYSSNGKFYFTPEETMFLIEIGSLELFYGKMPLSAEEAYALVLGDPLSVEKYLTYSCLSRSGFVVVKHNEKLSLCTAENLDDHSSQKNNSKSPKKFDKQFSVDDSVSSPSSYSSSDAKEEPEEMDIHADCDESFPEKVITPPAEEDISFVSISENVGAQDVTASCQDESQDQCLETSHPVVVGEDESQDQCLETSQPVVVDEEESQDQCLETSCPVVVGEDKENSTSILETLHESNDAVMVSSVENSADQHYEYPQPAEKVCSASVESEIIVHSENKIRLGFDDDSLSSGKLVIVEPDATEIDVVNCGSGGEHKLPVNANLCISHADDNATSYITSEDIKESNISPGSSDSSDSSSENRLAEEKDSLDSADSGEEINVDEVSCGEKECDEEINPVEKECAEPIISVDKFDDQSNSVDKEAEKVNSADEFIDVEQIDTSDDESVKSLVNNKQATQVSDSSDSGESSDKSSSAVSDSSDDSSDSDDDKHSENDKGGNDDVKQESNKDVNTLSSGSQNSENVGVAVDDSEIVFLEVKPKESKPLAVIDLLSESDSEADSKPKHTTADDDDVLIICEELGPIDDVNRRAKRRLAKKEKLAVEKEREELPLKKSSVPSEWPFPDFAGKSVICLTRPPPHLLPPNVRPNKEVYPIDSVLFSRSNGSFEKQGHRRDWHDDRRSRTSHENRGSPSYNRPYRRFETQREKSTYLTNYTDRNSSNTYHRNQEERDDSGHSRSKRTREDQAVQPHNVNSACYRDRNISSTSCGNREERESSNQGITERSKSDRPWEHSVSSRYAAINISNPDSMEERDGGGVSTPKRRYEDRRQSPQYLCSTSSKGGFVNESRWGAMEEFVDGNSRVSSTSKTDYNYRAPPTETQKYDNSHVRFPNRFADSRYPLDLRPDGGRNLHLRHDEVSSSSSPVYNENRDCSPHRQQSHHRLMQHSSGPHYEHVNQRQPEASRLYFRRPLEEASPSNREWNESGRSMESTHRGPPYADALNLSMSRSEHSPNPQDRTQPSAFQVPQKPYVEQNSRLDNTFILQKRAVENLNSECDEGSKMGQIPTEIEPPAKRSYTSAVENDSPKQSDNVWDCISTVYRNDVVEPHTKLPRLDPAARDRRKGGADEAPVIGNSVGSPQLPVPHNRLPLSLLEMIESAKNSSSHGPVFGDNVLNEGHTSQKAVPMSNYSSDFSSEAQDSGNKNNFISLQTNSHSYTYASNNFVQPNMAQENLDAINCSDERNCQPRRRVVIEGTSDLSICAPQSNTNSEIPERTFNQPAEHFREQPNHWDSRTNFRDRDASRQHNDTERWRGGNYRRRTYRPHRYGGSYHHRRQYHGPSKEVNYPSAIEKLPDRISSWGEYWSTLRRLEQPQRMEAEPSAISIPVEEILWSKDIQPLVKPGTRYPVADVLSSLRITQCLNLVKMENLCDRFLPRTCSMEITFDVYLPGTRYSKKSPGTPSHRIVVTRSIDSFPRLAEVVALQKKFSDGALLQFAIVDCGEVAFYSFNDVSLPTLLPLEDSD